MRPLIALLLLILMVMSVTPTYVSDESYYLYPFIGYMGVGTNLPAGKMVEWTIDCVISFKGVKIQDMIPSAGNVIDDDIYTAQSFTLSEIFDISIRYCIRASLHLSTLYLWNGELCVDEQTIEEIDHDRDSWAQYKCFDILDGWSIGFYAVTSGDIQTTDNGMLMLLALLSVAVVVERGYSYIMKRRKRNEI